MILAILQGGGIQRRKSISFFAGSHTADQLALVSFIRFVVKEALATSIIANRKVPLLTKIQTRIFKASLTIIGYAIVAAEHHANRLFKLVRLILLFLLSFDLGQVCCLASKRCARDP